jgi:hypothetical protein
MIEVKVRLKNLFLYSLCASFFTIISSMILIWIFDSFHLNLSISQRNHSEQVLFIIECVLISPILESWIMSGGINLIKGHLSSDSVTIFLSALAWSLLHAVFKPIWGVLAFPGFLVFSFVYIKWRPLGYRWGLSGATLTHTFHNIAAVLLSIYWK